MTTAKSTATSKGWKRIHKDPPLYDQIYVHLRRAVMSGEFAPDEAIDVRSLAGSLGLSPMPIRDALRRLEALGAVVIQPKKMPRIAVLTVDEYDQLVQMRRLLETHAASLAGQNATDGDIAGLKARNDDIDAHWRQGNLHAALRANLGFHLALYGIAGQPLLLNAIENLWLRSGPYLNAAVRNAPSLPMEREELFVAHRKLIAALSQHHPSRIAAALNEDIERGIALHHTLLNASQRYRPQAAAASRQNLRRTRPRAVSAP